MKSFKIRNKLEKKKNCLSQLQYSTLKYFQKRFWVMEMFSTSWLLTAANWHSQKTWKPVISSLPTIFILCCPLKTFFHQHLNMFNISHYNQNFPPTHLSSVFQFLSLFPTNHKILTKLFIPAFFNVLTFPSLNPL